MTRPSDDEGPVIPGTEDEAVIDSVRRWFQRIEWLIWVAAGMAWATAMIFAALRIGWL